MIVEVNNKKYMFKWSHELPDLERKVKGFDVVVQEGDAVSEQSMFLPDPFYGSTTCQCYELFADDSKELVHEVKLNVYYKDVFDKEVGRKMTLTELLNYGRKTINPQDEDLKIVKHWYDECAQMYYVLTSAPIRLDDNGLFNREARTAIWAEYRRCKIPTLKDQTAQLDSIIEKLRRKYPALLIDMTIRRTYKTEVQA